MKNRFYQFWDVQRFQPESGMATEYRTAFQVDRDRVLYTASFRRLQNKTQVFWSGEHDFYRTRLTHSLEVAQIGRSICAWLQATRQGPLDEAHWIDADLVEAACLSHDLGHPPFGHAGERSLNHLMARHGGFEGNAQTLRLLVERIFSHKGTGMNPTRAFVDAILKYKTLWTELKGASGAAPENHFLYDEQHAVLDWVLGGNDFPIECTPGKPRDAFRSLECQVMDWADDTAYSLNDLADGVRAGFLTADRIQLWGEQHGEDLSPTSSLGKLIEAARRGRMDAFVGKRIGQYIQSTRLVERVNSLSHMSLRYRYALEVGAEQRRECALFKRLAYDAVFLLPQLKQLECKGHAMLKQLWLLLWERYVEPGHIDGQSFQLLPESVARGLQQVTSAEAMTDGDRGCGRKARLLCDFLADMTDGEAVRLYQRLFSPAYGSIHDWVG